MPRSTAGLSVPAVVATVGSASDIGSRGLTSFGGGGNGKEEDL